MGTATPLSAVDPAIYNTVLQQRSASAAGRAAAALHLEMVSKREELEQTGQLKPATIVNFNPVDLHMSGSLNLTVPPCNDPLRPPSMRLDFEFNGRVHKASYVTVRSPAIWPITTSVEHDSQSDEDVPKHGLGTMLPIGVVHELYLHYNGGATDSVRMGGVLIFEGDRHTIEPHKLAATEGMIQVPQRKQLSNKNWAYTTTPKLLRDELARIFQEQRNYCSVVRQQAQKYFDGGDEERKNINTPHRTWSMYAAEVGWIAKPDKWVTEELGNDAEQIKCVYCQASSENTNAHFCPNCKAPYDAYRTFMAGLHVPDVYLQLLKGDQRAAVLEEIKSRREGFEDAPAKRAKA